MKGSEGVWKRETDEDGFVVESEGEVEEEVEDVRDVEVGNEEEELEVVRETDELSEVLEGVTVDEVDVLKNELIDDEGNAAVDDVVKEELGSEMDAEVTGEDVMVLGMVTDTAVGEDVIALEVKLKTLVQHPSTVAEQRKADGSDIR